MESIRKLLQTKEMLFAVVAIVVTVLNLWLTTKLYPMAQNISDIRYEVFANAASINRLELDKVTNENRIWEELKYLRGKVDKIYEVLYN